MSLHDDYARLTPFELAFPDREGVQALSDALREQDGDADSPGMFVSLPAVVSFVRRLAGPDAAPALMHHFGMLAFHAVHFVRAGCPLYLLEASVARELVGEEPDAEPGPPTSAGYLQLPQHLFWLEGLGGRAPESLDGAFWKASDPGDLHMLTISGLRPDRSGFAAVALPAAPLSDARLWMSVHVREKGEDYASSLPGGDLDRLYSIQTAGELLKLVARFFAYAAASPEALMGVIPAQDVRASPQPSGLPYTLVRPAA